MADDIFNRFQQYDKEHCWQYEIRLRNLEEDLQEANLSLEDSKKLTVADFSYKEDKANCKKIVEFIQVQ